MSTAQYTLQWGHNERHGVSNHQRLNCLLKCLFKHRAKETSKLRVTDLREGNPPGTNGCLSQRAINAENVFIWWRHREIGHRAIRICIVQVCVSSTLWPSDAIWRHKSGSIMTGNGLLPDDTKPITCTNNDFSLAKFCSILMVTSSLSWSQAAYGS